MSPVNALHRRFQLIGWMGLLALAGLSPLAYGQSFSLPRVALQYWRAGDFPHRSYGHVGPVWVEGHDEDNDDGSGHWEDRDGDGEDDTWVPDTHWVDGAFANGWIVDGVYPDGQFGSLWATSAGSYPIDSPSSTYNAAATNRGYLNVPINLGESVFFRFWGFAPNGNCHTYSFSVFNPAGGVVVANSGFYAVNSSAESSFTAASGGVWRVDVRYHYATGVAPSSGTVSYFFSVGPVAQSIAFNAIPRHAVGDAPFAPDASASSGLPVAFSIVSGPATSANGAITVTGDGTVTVRAAQPGGVVGGSIWSAAPPVDRSFTVSGTAQSIVFPVIGSRAYGDAPFPLGATASSGLPVVLTVTSGPATISSKGVALTGAGNVTITAAQAGNAAYAPAPSVSRTFAVAPDTTVPTSPENLAASAIGTGGFTLAWSPASDNVGVTAYEVQRNGSVVGTVATPTMTFSGLVQATTYSLTVRARDSSGNWSWPSLPVSVKTAAFLPPRLALQYWQTGDYPNRPYGHESAVWVDGHDEDNDDGSGHWEDQDGDGADDTWVPDTHWVDGAYAYFWVWDGVYADGKFGSTWATTAGTFSLADDSGSGAVTERGYLLTPHAVGQMTVRAWFFAPSKNCAVYGVYAYKDSGTYIAGAALNADSTPNNGYVQLDIPLSSQGAFTIYPAYLNATQVAPSTGRVAYHLVVGTPQVITLDPIYNHACGEAPFTLSGTTDSGLPLSYMVVSGPATISGNRVTLTGEGTVVVRAYQAGGVYAGATWTAASEERSFTVRGQSQTISFPALADCAYGAPLAPLAATSSSGLPVSYAVVAGPATVSGQTIALTGVGTVTIAATQPGAGVFGPAQPVTRSFVVAKGTQTISFAAIPAHDYGDAPFSAPASSSASLPVTLSVASGPASVSGAMVTLTGLGPVVLTASQAGDACYHPASATRTFSSNAKAGYRYVTVQNGTCSPVGGPVGSTVQIRAGQPPDHCKFTRWSIVQGPGTIAKVTDDVTTLTLSDQDVTVCATMARLYGVTVIGGSAETVRKPAGETLTLTANPDSGGQYFSGWSLVSGCGGIATPAARTTAFTVGPGDAVVRANVVNSHTLGVIFGSGVAGASGGVRGTSIQLWAAPVPAGLVFDGWQVIGPSGLVVGQGSPSATFVMGNTDTLVMGWVVPPEYRANQIVTTVSPSQSTVSTHQAFSVAMTGSAPAGSLLTDLMIETSSDFGERWSVPAGWPWQGASQALAVSRSAVSSTPSSLVYRVRGSRNDGVTTYASLYSYTRVDVLLPGSLEVINGTASASGGPPNSTVTLKASVPPGMVFTTWRMISGVGAIATPTSPQTTFTMQSGGAIVQAEFLADYRLTVQNGTASAPGGILGTTIELVAETRSEAFVGWTFNGAGSTAGTFANAANPRTTFTMGNMPVTVRANFAGSLQHLTLWNATAGATSGRPGTTTTLTATPLPNFYFDRWRFVGLPHGTVASPTSRSTLFTFGLGDTGLEPNYALGSTLTVQDGEADFDGGIAGRVIAIRPKVPPGFVFTSWARDSALATGTIADPALPHTTFTMGTGNAAIQANYVPAPPPPVVTAGSASATVGVGFTYQIQATNMSSVGSSFGVTQLPAGLGFNAATGLITGTPAQAGSFTLNVSATNVAGTDTKPLVLTIAKGNQSIAFGPLADRTTGNSVFSLSGSASSGLPVTYAVLSGPASVSGNVVTLSDAGTVVVRASQPGNANYFPANAVDCRFQVTGTGGGSTVVVITTQPADQTVVVGQPALFSVGAIGGGGGALNFQWRRDGIDLQDINGQQGSNTGNLSLPHVTPADAGSYVVEVTGLGGASAISNPAMLAVVGNLGAPLATAATDVTSSYFTANWGAVVGATDYGLDVSTSPTFAAGAFVAPYQNLLVGAQPFAVVTGLTAGRIYHFRVRAVDRPMASLNSNTVSATTVGSFGTQPQLNTHLPSP